MNLIEEKKLINIIHEVVKTDGFVIIPEWGAFFLQPTAARWDVQKQIFYAPGYQLLFNPRIQNNDGVLAIKISKQLNCSYFESIKSIANLVAQWNTHLYQWSSLKLDNLGIFVLQKELISFESEWNGSAFPEYFGLQNLSLQNLTSDRGVIFSYPPFTSSNKINVVVKALVLVPLALTLALLPTKINNYQILQNQSASFSQKIQLHQFIENPQDISKTIDTITNFKMALQIDSKNEVNEPTKKEEKTGFPIEEKKKTQQQEIIFSPQQKYFVIIGSFTNEKQVNEFLVSLKSINIDGVVLNCDGKRRVALNGFDNQADAQKALDEFKSKNPTYSGWILKW